MSLSDDFFQKASRRKTVKNQPIIEDTMLVAAALARNPQREATKGGLRHPAVQMVKSGCVRTTKTGDSTI
jgi:hypothetical protein